jgi:hypothetical protein
MVAIAVFQRDGLKRGPPVYAAQFDQIVYISAGGYNQIRPLRIVAQRGNLFTVEIQFSPADVRVINRSLGTDFVTINDGDAADVWLG